jgi:hypothetical protein
VQHVQEIGDVERGGPHSDLVFGRFGCIFRSVGAIIAHLVLCGSRVL